MFVFPLHNDSVEIVHFTKWALNDLSFRFFIVSAKTRAQTKDNENSVSIKDKERANEGDKKKSTGWKGEKMNKPRDQLLLIDLG